MNKVASGGAAEGSVVPIGKRASARARVFLPAKLDAVSGRHSVLLLSLSCSGAMVAIDQSITIGATIVLLCESVDAIGTVVWTQPGYLGMHFDEPVDDTIVLNLARQSDAEAAKETKTFRRPSLRGDELTDEDRKVTEQWMHSSGSLGE